MKDQSRNLNPTPEAVVAMYIYGDEYARQGGGSMDFWDRVPNSKKRVCSDCLKDIHKALQARKR